MFVQKTVYVPLSLRRLYSLGGFIRLRFLSVCHIKEANDWGRKKENRNSAYLYSLWYSSFQLAHRTIVGNLFCFTLKNSMHCTHSTFLPSSTLLWVFHAWPLCPASSLLLTTFPVSSYVLLLLLLLSLTPFIFPFSARICLYPYFSGSMEYQLSEFYNEF